MGYLFSELGFCLLLAAILGFILGWLAYWFFICRNKHVDESELHESKRRITLLEDENRQATGLLSEAQKAKPLDLDALEVEEIEGIGPAIGRQLRSMDIPTVEMLLRKGLTKEGRDQIHSGVTEVKTLSKIERSVVDSWVSMSDLLRVPGVGKQFSELMEACGVRTVGELREQESTALAAKMLTVNTAEHITTEQVPGPEVVNQWIHAAQDVDIRLKF